MGKTAIINPNARTPAPFAAIEPPLYAQLIAGYLESKGERCIIIDAEAEDESIERTIKFVDELCFCDEIIIVVMGNNPSVSSTPKMVAAEEYLKHWPHAKLAGLHPVAVNHPNAMARPFEGCPKLGGWLNPAFYRAHNWHCLDDLTRRSPYAVLYTSLNCPFACSYCNIHALYGDRKLRYRPLEDIKADLHKFVYWKIRNLKMWDELFCMDESRVLEICDYIIAQGFNFNIWAYARVDTVTQKMLSRMKRAGINWLAYGFESARDGVRQQSGKKFEDSRAKKAIDMTRDAGINIIANFMFGLPGETEDSMMASLDMAIRENFEYVNFSVALPYPGSPWYDSLPVKPTDWSSLSQFSPNICADPAAVKFRDEAFQTYFNRPEYLSMIRAKFGEKAETHIKEMVAWKIRS